MRIAVASLIQMLDQKLTVEDLDTLTPVEARRLAGLLHHWRELADLRTGLPAVAVSRETHACGCKSGRCRPDRAAQANFADLAVVIDGILDAGGELAQELQDIIGEALVAAGESTPAAGTAVAAMQAKVDGWEAAYAAFDAGTPDDDDTPRPDDFDRLPPPVAPAMDTAWNGDWERK